MIETVETDRTESGVSVEDPKAYRDAIIREIAAENALVMSRMTWNLTFQGFLFAGFGLALGAEPGQAEAAARFLEMMPIAGIAAAASAWIGIQAAFVKINELKRLWHQECPVLERHGPQPFSNQLGDFAGRIPSWALAATIIFVWLYLGLPVWSA